MSLIRDCIVSLGLTIFPTSQLSHPTLSHCYALIWKVCKISLFLLICRAILGHLVLWNKLDSIFQFYGFFTWSHLNCWNLASPSPTLSCDWSHEQSQGTTRKVQQNIWLNNNTSNELYFVSCFQTYSELVWVLGRPGPLSYTPVGSVWNHVLWGLSTNMVIFRKHRESLYPAWKLGRIDLNY